MNIVARDTWATSRWKSLHITTLSPRALRASSILEKFLSPWFRSKGRYTPSVKMCDFLCDVIPDGKTEQFWQAIQQASELSFPIVFHKENCPVHPGLANSKRHHSHTHKKTHRTEKKKNWQTWWKTCAVPENIQFSFSFSFFFLQLNGAV